MNMDVQSINLNHMQKRLRKLINQARDHNGDIHYELDYLPVNNRDEQALYMIHIDLDYRHFDQTKTLALLSDLDLSMPGQNNGPNGKRETGAVPLAPDYQYQTNPEDSRERTEYLRNRVMDLIEAINANFDFVEANFHQLSLEALAGMERALARYTREQEQWLKAIDEMVKQ